ncbi:MAG TPA: 30S ribosomal protein S8 [Candidatus Paceibacterota bacterium]|nr:30S ribosomal protein S8 [Candidatus Paceibacterota bacterium]
MVDPIADMLNRIRNAQAVKKENVEVPYSTIKYGIARILESNGFIKGIELKGKRTKKIMELGLQYKDAAGQMGGAKRVSRPGQRQYVSALEIPRVKGGHGIAILSTSKGLMSNREAKKAHIGGEILCEIW